MLIRASVPSCSSVSASGLEVDRRGVALPTPASVDRDPGAAAPGLGAMPPDWFRDNAERLWRIVARLGVPVHAVDDIVQEAFITAGRRQADIAPGQERSFLIATAIRLCSNYRQRAHVRRELARGTDFERDEAPGPNAEQLLIEKRLREQLEGLLGQLSDEHRTVFVLFELEGFTVPEMAALLALPLGTVSSRLWRARAKFSELAALSTPPIELESP